MKQLVLAVVLGCCLACIGCGDSDEGGAIQYVALGASDAVGIGAVPLDNGYVFLVEEGIEGRCGRTELRNLGIPGAHISSIGDEPLEIALNLMPEVVTIWTGANDLVGGDPVEGFESELQSMLERLQTETSAVLLIGTLPALEQLPAFADDPDPDVTAERVSAYNAAIRRQAEQHGAAVVDLASLTVDDVLVSADGFHPSNEGHAEIARRFLDSQALQSCPV